MLWHSGINTAEEGTIWIQYFAYSVPKFAGSIIISTDITRFVHTFIEKMHDEEKSLVYRMVWCHS